MRPPAQLSPSSVSMFRNCPLSWRLDHLERLVRVPTLDASIGTFVHAVAEALCSLPPHRRTLEEARSAATRAWALHIEDEEWRLLAVSERAIPSIKRRAWRAVQRWFAMEDPSTVEVAGTEQWVNGTVGGVAMRGIVDRLDVDEASGGFVVTDYKTGKKPHDAYQDERLFGVWVYAHLVAQAELGRPVTAVRHLYLGDRPGEVVRPVTDEALEATAATVTETHHEMIECCTTGTFESRTGPLCNWCAYQSSCPQFGGDLVELLTNGARRPRKEPPVDEDQQALTLTATPVSVG